MTICTFCKKKYKGYLVIISNDIECFIMEDYIKKIYYSDKKNIGVCKECRKIEIYNPVHMIQGWLYVRCQLILAKDNAKEKGNIKKVKEYNAALKRVKECEKKLEDTVEVQDLYLRNNPAGFKPIPKEAKLCDYCKENKGQEWINNPNGEAKLDTCWWVCKTCIKLMEKQTNYTFLSHFYDKIKEENLPKLEKKVKQKTDKLLKEINDIAYEDGQEVVCFQIKKDKNGKLESKQVY